MFGLCVKVLTPEIRFVIFDSTHNYVQGPHVRGSLRTDWINLINHFLIISVVFSVSNLRESIFLYVENMVSIPQVSIDLLSPNRTSHYDDVIMSAMASQITSLTAVYSTVYWGADQRKHQSSALLAFVWGIHRWIPRTKDQLRGKCFHLMTSSCRMRVPCTPKIACKWTTLDAMLYNHANMQESLFSKTLKKHRLQICLLEIKMVFLVSCNDHEISTWFGKFLHNSLQTPNLRTSLWNWFISYHIFIIHCSYILMVLAIFLVFFIYILYIVSYSENKVLQLTKGLLTDVQHET